MKLYILWGFAALCCAAGAVIKQLKPEIMPAFISLTSCGVIAYAVGYIAPILDGLNDMAQNCGLGDWFAVIVKALAGTVGCQICADLCRDCGETALAGRVELACRVYILLIALPIAKQIISLTGSLLS